MATKKTHGKSHGGRPITDELVVELCEKAGAGRPIVVSKMCRSWTMSGLPYASTMTIVRPVPVTPDARSGVTSYAFWICDT